MLFFQKNKELPDTSYNDFDSPVSSSLVHLSLPHLHTRYGMIVWNLDMRTLKQSMKQGWKGQCRKTNNGNQQQKSENITKPNNIITILARISF